jgi:membrane protein implicated in regulation of membrane protease activity
MAWLPVTSLRFWTFFLAFSGLTGMLLTLFGLASGPVVIAAISGVIGYSSGWAVVATIRHLSRNESNSAVSERDYVGATGRVMVPVSKDKVGKVRIEIKGRTVEMLARTEDDIEFKSQQPVIIYAVADDHVLVTRAE